MPILSAYLLVFAAIFGIVTSDPDNLLDVCVGIPSSSGASGDLVCKADSQITADDFYYTNLCNAANLNNSTVVITPANVLKFPGLNTQGLSLSRIDYAPGGLNPPHLHPRASEVVFVLEGEIDVGFITTKNKLFSKILKKGDIFVFPRGLIHYQKNIDIKPAAMLAAFNSQLPGTQSLAAALFSASPELPEKVLTEAFHVGTKGIQRIKAKLAPK